jgi:serine/threonine protein kinase
VTFQGYCYGTQVAVKKFKNQGFDPEVLKEVRKEVRIMKYVILGSSLTIRSLHHPNLLLFLGACTKPGHLMIVTELMEKSFHEISQSKVDLSDKLKMAKEAAKGMSWLHSLSPAIIHRDLKVREQLIHLKLTSPKIF